LTTSSRRPSPASRASRRSRRPAPRQASFLERYRNRILVIAGVLIFGLIVAAAFLNSTQPTYACANLFDPTPAPSFVAPTVAPGSSAAPETAPPPGFVEPDMGHLHVDPGTKVTYANCPPASGKHYNASGLGPIAGGLYGPGDATVPEGWVHNLEHGAIVLLYSCPNGVGPGCTDAGQAALGSLLTKWPASPICKIPPGKLTPVITRFDDMKWPYAAVVWDVVLPMQTLDQAALFDFYAQRGEQYNQEKQCAAPTPSPAPTPTAGPTTTAGPATSAASPAASPAASTAPAAS
jgi:hypothetical protein